MTAARVTPDMIAGRDVAGQIFAALARQAGATEAVPLILGNVTFWAEGGELVYGVPTSGWERAGVERDTWYMLQQLSHENPVEYGRLEGLMRDYKTQKGGA